MYKETRIIQASEIGYNNRVRITDLIDMIQDVEGAHIESLSALAKESREQNFAIVLNFRYVHIKYWPKYKDMLELTTYPYETKQFLGYRNTLIHDLMGNLLVESYCLGSFIHMDSKAPHRLSNEVLRTLGNRKKHDMTYMGRKISLNRKLVFIKSFDQVVLPSHLDYYQHLNNAVYVDFAYNMLPLDFQFSTLVCEYKKDFQLFQKMVLKLYQTEEGFLVQFFDESQTLYSVIEFK